MEAGYQRLRPPIALGSYPPPRSILLPPTSLQLPKQKKNKVLTDQEQQPGPVNWQAPWRWLGPQRQGAVGRSFTLLHRALGSWSFRQGRGGRGKSRPRQPPVLSPFCSCPLPALPCRRPYPNIWGC